MLEKSNEVSKQPIEVEKLKQKEPKEKISTYFEEGFVISENSDSARDLYSQSRYGKIVNSKVQLTYLEAMYLFEKGKILVKNDKGKELTQELFSKKIKKYEHKFNIRYAVYNDLRSRGYIVKTALKFGAEFRVYDKGIKPGDDHAKWIVYPVHENEIMTWYDFSAKNRVAHSTKKHLLIGIVDEELDVIYYEIKWIRP